MAQLVEVHQHGDRVVVEAARTGFFDSIPHHRLLDLVAGERAAGNSVRLITQCLQAGGMEEDAGRPTRQGTPHGGGRSPRLATLVLTHLDGRVEARGDTGIRSADDCVVRCTTTRQAAQALEAVTACVEDDLGVALTPDQTHRTTCGQGGECLGSHVTARPIRMGGKAEERCKMQSQERPTRRHHLDAAGVTPVNRGVRGTGRSFATAVRTGLGQFHGLDRWIRMRIRGMQEQRIWKTANRRVKSRHSSRMGVVLCREVDGGAREGEETDSSQEAMSLGSPGVRKTPAGQ
jgi:RNA-directed DNA polymerase